MAKGIIISITYTSYSDLISEYEKIFDQIHLIRVLEQKCKMNYLRKWYTILDYKFIYILESVN